MAVEVITVQLPGSPGSPGPQGVPGPANVLTIGTVTTTSPGTSGGATITGVAPNQVLNLSIPQGPVGATGATGASPTFTVGTINTGTPGSNAIATLTGTAPNYVLNLTIPRGNAGLTGPANVLTVGTVTTTAPGTSASVSITGTAPTQTISFTIPQGPQGIQGLKGDPGAQGIQGIQGLKGDPGNAVGVPIGGASGAVLSKNSANDYDTSWTLVATTGDVNSLVKRDANGRAQIANAVSAADIMNKQTVAVDIGTHAALTSSHGASGNLVGENNTQVLTNKTLTAPKASILDLATTDTPGNPTTGYNRLAISSTGAVSTRTSAGVIRQFPTQWPTTASTFPSSGMSAGDTCYHTGLRSMYFYDGTVWRQQRFAVFDTEASFNTFKSTLGTLPIDDGFIAFCKDTDRRYQLTYGNFNWWVYIGGGATPQFDLPLNTTNADNYATNGTFPKAQYGIDGSGVVHLSGLLTLKVAITPGQRVPVATLPAGYRPQQYSFISGNPTVNVFDVSIFGSQVSRIDIDHLGVIYVVNNTSANFASTSFMTLQGIHFIANQNPVVA